VDVALFLLSGCLRFLVIKHFFIGVYILNRSLHACGLIQKYNNLHIINNKHQENKEEVITSGDGYVGGSNGVYLALTHSCSTS
jgi:sulfur transfer complex TusBCD TusB component (DsrH family)